MSNKLKSGSFQIIIIGLFVIASFSLSRMLENDAAQSQNYISSERLLYVKTEDITPGEYQISFDSTGTVEATHEIGIVPQVSGRVVWVNEKLYKGEVFDEGEPLFEIDRSDYDLEVVRMEAEVAKANTALDIELAETKAAIEEWKQINGNLDAPDLVFRKPQLLEAHARLKAALAQREKARLSLSRTIFRLPFGGQIIKSNLAEGQFVTMGQTYGNVYDSRSLELHSSLSDDQLKIILNSNNSKVGIEIKSYGKEKIYKGYIKRSATEIDRSTRFAHVRFAFHEPTNKILVGSFAKINVQADKLENVSVIPSNSLQKDRKILVVDSNNIISKIQPDIIQSMDNFIAIKGMDQPFKIVVGNMPGAIEGMVVTTDSEIK